MKRILVYGDSNTWGWAGWAGAEGCRFDSDTRYPQALAKLLGNGWELVEEGCPGRTTVYDSDVDSFVNGRDYLYPCLHSHSPLDVITLMLGTNDLSNGVHMNAYYAAAGTERLVNEIHRCSHDFEMACPKILVISPPLIGPYTDEVLAEVFDYPRAIPESKRFRRFYADIAEKRGCAFLAAEDYTVPNDGDGIHITAESHLRLARAIYDKMGEMGCL